MSNPASAGPAQVEFTTDQTAGGVAALLSRHRMDTGALRPWISRDGRQGFRSLKNGFTVNEKGVLVPRYRNIVANDATLYRDEWKHYDTVVQETARAEMNLAQDLISNGLVYDVPGGMGKMVVESPRIGHAGSAEISMDGLSKGLNDRPETDWVGVPLPIIHADWFMSLRDLEASRQNIANGGAINLDTTMAREAAYNCTQELEKMVAGTSTKTFAYAGYSIYGYKNSPLVNSKIITAPTAPGWVPATLYAELLSGRKQLYDKNHLGPYQLYFSPDWIEFIDNDYSALTPSGQTLRQKILSVPEFKGLKIANYLSGWDILIVEMKTRNVRLLRSLPFRNIQWSTDGGFNIHFKTFGIFSMEIRADKDDQCGVLHASDA